MGPSCELVHLLLEEEARPYRATNWRGNHVGESIAFIYRQHRELIVLPQGLQQDSTGDTQNPLKIVSRITLGTHAALGGARVPARTPRVLVSQRGA